MQLFTSNPTVKLSCYLSYNRFLFLGENITLKSSVGIFITMNSGYGGQTELPENLKALFWHVCDSVFLCYTSISSLHLEYMCRLMLLALICNEMQFVFASEFLWKKKSVFKLCVPPQRQGKLSVHLAFFFFLLNLHIILKVPVNTWNVPKYVQEYSLFCGK